MIFYAKTYACSQPDVTSPSNPLLSCEQANGQLVSCHSLSLDFWPVKISLERFLVTRNPVIELEVLYARFHNFLMHFSLEPVIACLSINLVLEHRHSYWLLVLYSSMAVQQVYR